MEKVTVNILALILTLCVTFSLSTFGYAQDTSQQTTERTPTQLPQQPPWQVCNETSFILDVAIAGVPAGQAGQPVSVWGWQSLRPGKCQIVDVEKGTPRFVYARSDTLHQGGVREWKGRYEYCVSPEDFTAQTDIACDLQNMSAKQFLQIIPTESRTAFIEPSDYGRFAETAGLQRLLGDNNYDIKRIDGRTGKRTSNTLKKFLKDNELNASINIDAQYKALREAAVKTRQSVGVKLCNNSSAKVWTALAYSNNETMESRGWWPIEMGTCIQPFTENLKNRDVHYYARQESIGGDDKIIKVATKKFKPFCIGPSTFSALRHEFCQDQGYVSADFKEISEGKLGVQIDLGDADFNSAAISGLR